jgi:hypothetical protein
MRILPAGLDLPAAPEWVALALCAETDPEAFFPEPGNSNASTIAQAVRICRRCDVREDCLEYADQHGIPHGIWGGETPNQRDERRKLTGAAARPRRRRTECSAGHALIEGNIRVRRNGSGVLCLKCEAKRGREWRAKQQRALQADTVVAA